MSQINQPLERLESGYITTQTSFRVNPETTKQPSIQNTSDASNVVLDMEDVTESSTEEIYRQSAFEQMFKSQPQYNSSGSLVNDKFNSAKSEKASTTAIVSIHPSHSSTIRTDSFKSKTRKSVSFFQVKSRLSTSLILPFLQIITSITSIILIRYAASLPLQSDFFSYGGTWIILAAHVLQLVYSILIPCGPLSPRGLTNILLDFVCGAVMCVGLGRIQMGTMEVNQDISSAYANGVIGGSLSTLYVCRAVIFALAIVNLLLTFVSIVVSTRSLAARKNASVEQEKL